MGNDLHQPGKQAGGAADNDQRVGENKDPHGLGEGHPCRALTNSAAPGVDQAVSTGTFRQALSARVLMPMARPRAVIQPAICPG